MVGHNICESAMTYAQVMFDAQEAGAKVICIDPRYSVTASKADQWIPIKPGTDPAFMLGMLAVILENEWYDTDFMVKNTSFRFWSSATAARSMPTRTLRSRRRT
jgi:molybdopterin-containing oxidoreductase family molybdopterin binding subunit